MDAFLVAAMFAALLALLMFGFPVAFTLAGTALLFGVIGSAAGVLDPSFLEFLPNRLFENVIRNDLLFAVPLFVTMGVVLEKSRVAEDLLNAMGNAFGSVRGGLGISVTIVGALLAASTGIVGATVVTMGLLSLPTMLKRGYDPALASGSIAAAGTLGQIIPPSIVLILLADVMSNAWQQAQRDQGVFNITPMTAGELFAGAIVPGLLLVIFYVAYQAFTAITRPESSPAAKLETARDAKFWRDLLRALLPPLFLIIAVLGSILSGIATPTEAASVGAVGAILLGTLRLGGAAKIYSGAAFAGFGALLALSAAFNLKNGDAPTGVLWLAYAALGLGTIGTMLAIVTLSRAKILGEAMATTIRISSMIYTILIGAALFSLVFRGLGGDDVIAALLESIPGGTTGALIFVMLLMFVLGFFLDFIEITFVVVPLIAPALLMMDGIPGPVWLGVLMAMNLQTSFLTPPFGFALFYLRGVAGKAVDTGQIYRGAMPFVAIQLLALLLIALVPDLVTWLPAQLFSG